MSKVLVIFYSYTGTARRLAQLLCAQQGWAMAEVLERRPRTGARGTWRCVLDSVFRRRPAFRYQGPIPDGFDVVMLIAPIWVSRLAGPMRSFVHDRRTMLPDVAVLSVMGSRGAPAADGAGAAAQRRFHDQGGRRRELRRAPAGVRRCRARREGARHRGAAYCLVVAGGLTGASTATR